MVEKTIIRKQQEKDSPQYKLKPTIRNKSPIIFQGNNPKLALQIKTSQARKKTKAIKESSGKDDITNQILKGKNAKTRGEAREENFIRKTKEIILEIISGSEKIIMRPRRGQKLRDVIEIPQQNKIYEYRQGN